MSSNAVTEFGRLILGMTVALACGRPEGVPPPPRPPVAPEAVTERVVDVGGRRLHATVRGSGSPTVVLLSALDAPQDYWNTVTPMMAARTTVVTYDRAGTGKSELGNLPAHAEQSARDLRVLLDSLHTPPPFLLVAHSAGGNVARVFAFKYPETIAGVVLEETQHEENLSGMRKVLTGSDLATFERDLASQFDAPASPRTERDFSSATRDQLRKARPLPHVPFVVLVVAGRGRDMRALFSEAGTERIVALDAELMKSLASSVPGGRLIVVEGSGHNLHVDKPDALLGPVLGMIADIQGRDRDTTARRPLSP